MEFKVNKDMLKGIGNVGLKLGKTIVIEGTKAVILNAAATTIKTSFDEGFAGVKDLTFDELLDGKDKKKKSAKGGLFGKKNKNEDEEVVVEILDADGSKVTK
jgi:hypothetical protein